VQYADFKIFSLGHSRDVSYAVQRKHGRQTIHLANYKYTTGSGRNQTTNRQIVCIVEKEDHDIPHFFLRREVSIYDHLGKLFGKQDVNFEDDPEFSKAFVLQGENEEDTRKLFHAGTRQIFMEFAGSKLCVEGRDNILVAHYGKILPIAEAEKLMDDAMRMQSTLR
jgi:hypothetical protein